MEIIIIIWHLIFAFQVIEDGKTTKISTNLLNLNNLILIYLNYRYLGVMLLILLLYSCLPICSKHFGLADALYIGMIYGAFSNFSRFLDYLAFLSLVTYGVISMINKKSLRIPFLPIVFMSHILNNFIL